MTPLRRSRLIPRATLTGLLLAAGALSAVHVAAGEPAAAAATARSTGPVDVIVTPNRFGKLGTASTNGFDTGTTNGFFTPLGSNGRTCATCHAVEDDYSLSPATVKKVARRDAADPLFDPVDGGSNCPPEPNQGPDASRAGLLLSRALIREQIAVPAGADFSLRHATNPHHCRIKPASPEIAGKLFLFRRPLPTTNLFFLSDLRWDGRATAEPITTGPGFSNMGPLLANLAVQANTASIGHELSPPLLGTPELADIVAFERHLYSAQKTLAPLGGLGERAGPRYLATTVARNFFIGQNDPFGSSFNPQVFTLFADWEEESGRDRGSLTQLQRAIGDGERIFNTRTFRITNVPGLNSADCHPLYNPDDPFAGRSIVATCSACHNTPNVGNHSRSLMLNTGVTYALPRNNRGRPMPGALELAGLPVYTLQSQAGDEMRMTDPARALITGRWTDMGKVKVPVLRGLAARPPYFHNGSAKDLAAVVDFYDARFEIGLTPEERRALALFLAAL